MAAAAALVQLALCRQTCAVLLGVLDVVAVMEMVLAQTVFLVLVGLAGLQTVTETTELGMAPVALVVAGQATKVVTVLLES